MEKKITFRTVIEVLGKPKEHVEKSLKDYLEQLKKDNHYLVVGESIAEAEEQKEEGLFATFAELELKTDSMESLTAFCFNYMPSLMEIIEPKELEFTDLQISQFLNDLQAKLHQVDMLAKQVKMENDILKKSIGHLLKNYVTLLLSGNNLTSQQLSRMTGVDQDKLEDFLDKLIDDGKIDLKEGIYFLREKGGKSG